MLMYEVMNKYLLYYYGGKVMKLQWLANFNLTFVGKVYVGLDQSSSCTGLYIRDDSGNKFMTEFVRGDVPVSKYNRVIVETLKNILKDVDVRLFVYEEHGRNISGLDNIINEVTDALKGYSKVLRYRNVETYGVLPGVWRKGLLQNEELETGSFRREAIKEICYQKIVSMYPELSKFRKYCHSSDLDCYEAAGILEGSLNLLYAPDGNKIVSRVLGYNSLRKTVYSIHKCNVSYLGAVLDKYRSKGNVEVYYSNSEVLIDEAVNRVCGTDGTKIIVYRRCLEYCRFVLEIEEVIGDDELFYVVCKRKGRV